MEKDIKYFKAGDKLTAQALNEMLDNIAENQEGIEEVKEQFSNIKVDLNIENGSCSTGLQQKHNPDKVAPDAEGKLSFSLSESKNPYAPGKYLFGSVLTPEGRGIYSVSLNGRSSAQGDYSLAVNNQTLARGEGAFATGYATIADGPCSFTGGSGTYASGEGAVALGMKSHAKGSYSFALGANCIAKKDCSWVGGIDCVAENEYSLAFGKDIIAKGPCAAVFGMHNKVYEGSLFTIGTGFQNVETGEVTRDSALHVMPDRAILFYPIRKNEEDISQNPICLQDLIETIAANFDDLFSAESNNLEVHQGLQTQITNGFNELYAAAASNITVHEGFAQNLQDLTKQQENVDNAIKYLQQQINELKAKH